MDNPSLSTKDPAPGPLPAPPLWHPGSFVSLVRGHMVVLLVASLTVLFMLLTFAILRGDLQPTFWDIVITREVQLLPQPVIGDILVAISLPGFQPWNWLLAGAILLFMLWQRWYVEAVFTAIAAVGGLLAEAVKFLVDRPRPTPEFARIAYELHSYSFPSGHVTGYVTLYGFLFYLAYTLLPRSSIVRKILLVVLGAGILLVGVSRVYMGQHWASDALAGYALGFAYLLVVIEGYRAWLKRHPKPAVPPVPPGEEVGSQ